MKEQVETTSLGREGWATSVITELVRPTEVAGFEEWTIRANANLAKSEGFVGIDTIRVDEEGTPRYVTLIHFESQSQLDAWEQSPSHQALLAELEPMIDHKTVQRADGLEIWYSLPARNRRRNPAYWRQVVLTTPVVFGLIVIVNTLLSPIDGGMPSLLALAVSVTIVSMLLAWPVMPVVTRLFRSFLYPEPE